MTGTHFLHLPVTEKKPTKDPIQSYFDNRSATHTFMIDCRGTPKRRASLSRDLIIHSGKSTLTLLIACPGLCAPENSKYLVISSPLSNRLSKSVAFINIRLFLPRA